MERAENTDAAQGRYHESSELQLRIHRVFSNSAHFNVYWM